MPDWQWTVEDTMAQGDQVVARLAFSGTHSGEWRGVPPTGNRVAGWGLVVYRISGTKIVEEWGRFHTYGWRQQLDMLPASE
jgi:predicted ester cyclase